MTLALLALSGVGIALPHRLRLETAPPMLAAYLWLAALALRALSAVLVALYAALWFPHTHLFALITDWCWHPAVPLVEANLSVEGHAFGDLAVLVPATALGLSLLAVVWGLWRAARSIGKLMRSGGRGLGPGGSVIIGGADVLVAAAGLARPRVLVSAGALAALDDEELAAGLAHERGHIARHHSVLLVAGELCRALARLLPGTGKAAAELAYHLERDADEYALQRAHDPLALASAICKAAGGSGSPALMALGGGRAATARLRVLASGDEITPGRPTGSLRVVAAALTALVLLMVLAAPAVAASGVGKGGHAASTHCRG